MSEVRTSEHSVIKNFILTSSHTQLPRFLLFEFNVSFLLTRRLYCISRMVTQTQTITVVAREPITNITSNHETNPASHQSRWNTSR